MKQLEERPLPAGNLLCNLRVAGETGHGPWELALLRLLEHLHCFIERQTFRFRETGDEGLETFIYAQTLIRHTDLLIQQDGRDRQLFHGKRFAIRHPEDDVERIFDIELRTQRRPLLCHTREMKLLTCVLDLLRKGCFESREVVLRVLIQNSDDIPRRHVSRFRRRDTHLPEFVRHFIRISKREHRIDGQTAEKEGEECDCGKDGVSHGSCLSAPPSPLSALGQCWPQHSRRSPLEEWTQDVLT